MKSTQDIHILLNKVAQILDYDLISITQYSDKSFQLDGYRENENKLLYNSDEGIDNLDINDFGYYSPEDIVSMIQVFTMPAEVKEVTKPKDIREEARARLAKIQSTNPLDNL